MCNGQESTLESLIDRQGNRRSQTSPAMCNRTLNSRLMSVSARVVGKTTVQFLIILLLRTKENIAENKRYSQSACYNASSESDLSSTTLLVVPSRPSTSSQSEADGRQFTTLARLTSNQRRRPPCRLILKRINTLIRQAQPCGLEFVTILGDHVTCYMFGFLREHF